MWSLCLFFILKMCFLFLLYLLEAVRRYLASFTLWCSHLQGFVVQAGRGGTLMAKALSGSPRAFVWTRHGATPGTQEHEWHHAGTSHGICATSLPSPSWRAPGSVMQHCCFSSQPFPALPGLRTALQCLERPRRAGSEWHRA